MSSPTILLADDEPAHLKTLERLFLKEGYQVLIAHDGQQALDLARRHEPLHLIVTDVMMPGVDGMELLQLVRSLRPEIEVILMTAFGTVELAVQGMKEGAYDFITKPIKRAEILKSVSLALERQALRAENRQLKAQLASLDTRRAIIGQSPLLRDALAMARQVARSDATVMLTGESGTGKELFARLIYELSERADRPFIALNCAALPESILESELFGYEKGAFTGATQRKIGRFEAAHRGTLFLDEIGELAPHLQVKLLRVLQERVIERLGANTPTPVDVRILCATHRDLAREVREGNFRDDLYYRLHVIPIQIPPLRKRPEDVPLLAAHFLARYRERHGGAMERLTPEALDALASYPWPGNVRELENVIERAVVLDRDGELGLDDLPAHVRQSTQEQAQPPARAITILLGTPLEEIELQVLQETLKLTGGNKKLAAKLLGIATRTIYRKLGGD